MTTIHTGNTTTTGFSVTSDATGDLVIKTGGSGGTTALTVDDNQIATFVNQPTIPVPAFRAYLSADQSVTSGETTKVNLDTISFDTNSWFDTANNRYTPQIAGYYQFNGIVRVEGVSQTTQISFLFKNGVQVTAGDTLRLSTSNPVQMSVSDIIYCNGSTDYVELHGYVLASSGTNLGYNNEASTCSLSGFLVRAA